MRIVYHCADRVGAEMAGPGIRAVELARRLSVRHDVTLVAEGADAFPDEPFRSAGLGAFAHALRDADALVTQGFGFPLRLALGFPGRVVLDLYDPVQLEHLAMFGPAPSADQRVTLVHVRARLHVLFRRADQVLCASERQRSLWLGWLGAAGRLTPDALRDDPEARALLAVVPFGITERPPVAGDLPLRRELGVGPDVPVAIWGGGLWDWMDPATVVRAAARLRDAGHPLRVAFLAGARPGGSTMRAADEGARRAAAALRLDGRVRFLERWIPYSERGALLLDATVAVSAHRASLEAEMAFRTRLLDCLWARLPVASTRGDTLSELAAAEGWGEAVPPGDADALAAALRTLCVPDRNAAARAAAARTAERYTWRSSATTLLDLLESPAPARPAGLVPAEIAAISGWSAAGALGRKMMRQMRRVRVRTSGTKA